VRAEVRDVTDADALPLDIDLRRLASRSACSQSIYCDGTVNERCHTLRRKNSDNAKLIGDTRSATRLNGRPPIHTIGVP